MKKIMVPLLFLVFLAPVISGQGNSYTGPYAKSKPIVVTRKSNRSISGLNISNSKGNCITLSDCSDITIENCKLGPAIGEGISIRNCNNIVIRNCSMESIRTGVYAVASSGIKVVYNDVKNVKGPMPRGQMVQFDKVTGPGNSISHNKAENISGESSPEDVISLFMSSGVDDDPIHVSGNQIRGGGPSVSGGGIMAGDRGGSYILVENNILVNPGQYGISVAGGHHITVRNNKIYAEKLPSNNVGLVAWNQYKNIDCYAITISNNKINYTNSKGILNNMWNAQNMGPVAGWETNKYSPELSGSILPQVLIAKYKSRVRNATPPSKKHSHHKYHHRHRKR
ncbi:MAG TPA: right-handed parallel beta-helix repeat-containing protein [Paludibacter sp.]|nr:right-handed parallel beta-helix repeat-containing protein [Paludibacter sp.]